jgi:hypothetical protein
MQPDSKIQITTTPSALSKEELRQLIREVIAENGTPIQALDVASETDSVASMLENMGVFG